MISIWWLKSPDVKSLIILFVDWWWRAFAGVKNITENGTVVRCIFWKLKHSSVYNVFKKLFIPKYMIDCWCICYSLLLRFIGVINVEYLPGCLQGIGWKKPLEPFDTSVFPYEIGIKIANNQDVFTLVWDYHIFNYCKCIFQIRV